MQTLTITRPDDFHLHVRDGAVMASVVPESARQFARAIIMPNLRPPVVNVEQANAYRQRILDCLPEGVSFEPLMTLYLTDRTTTDDIQALKDHPHVYAVKYYPAGATTNSDSGVTDINNVYPVLEKMAELGVPLLVHGEMTDANVDIFDRESVFIDVILEPLLQRLPELRIVFEHITTLQAVQFVMNGPANLAATITPQHMLYNRNVLFNGGLRPHYYCLPVLKREPHRQAVLDAAISGNAKFFLGTDSAPHAKVAKESACGCAGCYSAHNALELYTEIFDANNALDKLENFASKYGADFYGLPANSDNITLIKEEWQIPNSLPLGDEEIVPVKAGEMCHWKLSDV